jgi:hypothetical protein
MWKPDQLPINIEFSAVLFLPSAVLSIVSNLLGPAPKEQDPRGGSGGVWVRQGRPGQCGAEAGYGDWWLVILPVIHWRYGDLTIQNGDLTIQKW